MRSIDAKQVFVRPNGSIEFELWGFGCAPCTDSFKGILYLPTDGKRATNDPWTPKLVKSLNDESLPKEKGVITDGIYVLALEPKWFIYRAQIDD
jgi:hypothetical protein